MKQQCSRPTVSWPLQGRGLYYALLGLTQAPGFAGGHDWHSLIFADELQSASTFDGYILMKGLEGVHSHKRNH